MKTTERTEKVEKTEKKKANIAEIERDTIQAALWDDERPYPLPFDFRSIPLDDGYEIMSHLRKDYEAVAKLLDSRRIEETTEKCDICGKKPEREGRWRFRPILPEPGAPGRYQTFQACSDNCAAKMQELLSKGQLKKKYA